MPISQEEFEQGRIDLRVPILELLLARRQSAYSVAEIMQLLLEVNNRTAAQSEIQEALTELVQQGQIRTVQIDEVGWYIDEMYLQRIERGLA